MKVYMTKKEAGYRTTMGMRAVGNQCKDCEYAQHPDGKNELLVCEKLGALVKSCGTCGWLKWRDA